MTETGERGTMSRRAFLLGLSAGAVIVPLFGIQACSGERRARRPNIVFILTDDHRYDAFGALSPDDILTANLDRLAADGVRFTNAFVTTSLCSPSRAGFLTGCYAHRHGVVDNEVRDPAPELSTFPELLQAAGYETAFIGKWHQLRAAMPRPGFDHWVSFTGQGEYDRNTLNVDGQWELSERYITDELTERALTWLRGGRSRPFLLYLSHKAVHAPFEPADRHAQAYSDQRFASRHDPDDQLASKPDWGDRADPDRIEAMSRQYHRTLMAVDESVGQVQTTLADLGLLDDTVIVYAGDNGFHLGEHGGLVDKRTAYEASMRIPLIMRYPRLIDAADDCSAMVLNIDLAPTLLELADVPVPASMQGESWLELLQGGMGRDAFLYEYFPGEGAVPAITAVRTRTWKYIAYPDLPDQPEELYDLGRDPDELVNRAADPAAARQLADMRALLTRLKAETGFTREGTVPDRR